MIFRERRLSRGWQIAIIYVLVCMLIGAIILRGVFYPVITGDYRAFVGQWYDYIKSHDGFAAFKDNFYNYNPPYLYLLALTTFLSVTKIVAIKSIAVIFDGVLAIFTYLIVSLKYKRSYAAVIGALIILFTPTIFINSAVWGQCDAIYAAFCLGSLYFLLTDRPAWACVFFALAISFKLQAIFFFPVLLVLLLRKKLPIKYFIIIPVIFLLLLTPALVAGRSIGSLLTIYTAQISTGGVGGGQARIPGNGGQGGFGRQGGFTPSGNGGQGGFGRQGGFTPSGNGGQGGFGRQGGFTPSGNGGQGRFGGNAFSSSGLTYNAPSFYQWFSANASAYWKWLGIILAALFVVIVSIMVVVSKERLTSAIILKFSLAFVLTIPFLLPEMHERYFYLADVISIVFAFYFPRSFYVPLIVQFCSLCSYTPYLLGNQIVSLPLVAVAELIVIVVVLVDLVLTLYPTIRWRFNKSAVSGGETSLQMIEAKVSS